MSADLLMQILASISGGLACYVAIRVDIAVMKTRIDFHEEKINELRKLK